MITHLLIYVLSFGGIWIGSGLAVKSVVHLARNLRISSFIVSFFVLGLFTSMSEVSVGVNSILQNDPEIYVGTLIGASIVLFLLVVPLLSVAGHSIRISPEFQGFNLPASLVVIALPVLLAMDGKVDKVDSAIALLMFCFLSISLRAHTSWKDKIRKLTPQFGLKIGKNLVTVAFGLALIFVASHFLVEQTLYFSLLWGVSPFLVSLLLVAVGTNIPELSLVVRSLFMRNHQVAFGDYIGSAVFNTFLLGLLTAFYGRPVELTNSYVTSLLFLVAGLLTFYYFARTKNTISRAEGLVLLGIYVLFLLTEVVTHQTFRFLF